MKYIEISKELEPILTDCPQCKNPTMTLVGSSTFECLTCGLRIEVTKQSTWLIGWASIFVVFAFMVGLLLMDVLLGGIP